MQLLDGVIYSGDEHRRLLGAVRYEPDLRYFRFSEPSHLIPKVGDRIVLRLRRDVGSPEITIWITEIMLDRTDGQRVYRFEERE